ncbi:MAG: export ABC transporter ATP-binding protein, partial [Actinobacteria bacterium]|nr:export ABC transporter ATP-binding protein [Actinomycetota bacterium]
MEEAERLCDRVGIIDEGVLKAEGSRRELTSMVGERDRVVLNVSGDLEAAERACAPLNFVHEVSRWEEGLILIVNDARERLAELLGIVTQSGASVTGVEVVEPDLEAVFLHLTGRALRD